MPLIPKRSFVVLAGAALLCAAGAELSPEVHGASRVRHHTRHRFKSVQAAGVRALAGDAAEGDPPEVTVGERLFLETRFAQFFAAHATDVNRPLASGDPILDTTPTTGAPLPGAFAGQSMNCRSCHFVDDVAGFPGGRVNTYGDFARKSLVPLRDDGRTETPRNSPPLVDATVPRDSSFLLHFDGEFASTRDLVRGTFTGRNFGWLPGEARVAVAHIAHVVRDDDGQGDLARQYASLPYRVLLAGVDPGIPAELRLPAAYRIDTTRAGDDAVLDAVTRLVGAYVESLVFSQDDDGFFSGSPYDVFLAKNGLPRAPDDGESPADYSRRLLAQLRSLEAPSFVSSRDGSFELHDQAFNFGRKELAGLEAFLTSGEERKASAGNCAACHPAPFFTDFRFHNTGASQEEYDATHGDGAFVALAVPSLAQRLASPESYLPPSEARPGARGPFRSAASPSRPGETDLGLWNVYLNPDIPSPQGAIEAALGLATLTPDEALSRTLGLFKTPGLRDLGQSAPYLHTGRKDSLEDVVRFYASFSQKARLGKVRNASPEIARIFIGEGDVDALAAFLRSLNEDYQ